MKNIIYVVLAMIVLSSCQKQEKIGYVNNATLINDFNEKKDLEAKFKVRQETFTKKFDSIDQAFQVEVEKFQTGAKRMSQTKAQQKYQELGQKKQMLDQQKQIDAQQFQQAYQAEMDSLIVKVKDFVEDYGQKNNYTYIIGTTDAVSTIMYGKEENDLTQTILDALNDNKAKNKEADKKD
ncbi:OmpH family outer membrane protein [Sabulilitoribacter arenilitoris]|uniref:OmpH family outer membrane protein n=1 Tax=Wocania arenilitoris TaxID=2044858 RepID=A0AAE3JN12_9FLAO|nr:OmpH family outer membrane protein [Wocania arenilitoris]MCF7566755.1 OmpH family outer membrane protein [Wocania arenilitoris]